MIINDKDYKINRETARVTDWDKKYCELLKEIKDNGELCPNRTGIETLSIPHAYIKLDVENEFPILETKKLAIKNTITELLWIYQAQSNDVKWLHDRNNHIWDEWIIDDDGIYRIYDPFIKGNNGSSVTLKDLNGKPYLGPDDGTIDVYSKLIDKSIKDAKYYGKDYAGTIGTSYGYIVNKTKEFDNVLKSLKTNPRNRRMVVSLRQAEYLKGGVLEPCVWSSTYKCHKDRINSNISIRSNDMPLGNPFNVTQYAILLSLLANHANMRVGEISFDIADCHIYVNQLDGINLQLSRFDRLVKWESFIKNNTDEEIERTYKEFIDRREYLNKKIIDSPFLESSYKTIINETNEEIMCLEHLVTRENPYLYVTPNKDFYELDNKKDNEDIKVLKYTSLPSIKMPVAQ